MLELLSDASTVSFAIGKDDSLPSAIEIDIALDKSQLSKLDALADSPVSDRASDLDSLQLELKLSLSDWGKPVELTPPSNYESFDELLGQFLGIG